MKGFEQIHKKYHLDSFLYNLILPLENISLQRDEYVPIKAAKMNFYKQRNRFDPGTEISVLYSLPAFGSRSRILDYQII